MLQKRKRFEIRCKQHVALVESKLLSNRFDIRFMLISVSVETWEYT